MTVRSVRPIRFVKHVRPVPGPGDNPKLRCSRSSKAIKNLKYAT